VFQEVPQDDSIPSFASPKRVRGRPRTNFNPKVRVKDGPGRPSKKFGKTPVKVTAVFAMNKMSDAQIIVNRGGARSSKSYSIMQLLVEDFFSIPKIRILILRKASPSLRRSCKPLFYSILEEYNLRSRIIEVKQDSNVFSPVKGMVHFSGLDDPEKIKSTDWNEIFVEEASEFDLADYRQLKLRLSSPTYGSFRNRMFLSFNPQDENSWLKTDVIDNSSEDLIEIVSNYRMNPFLSDDYRRTIEALKYQDYNYWRIFSEGEWGKLEFLVYSHWKAVPEVSQGEVIYGLDFGFNHPSVLIKAMVDNFQVGVEQVIYMSGLTNSELISQMNRVMTPEERERCPIYADSAEPARIQEINDNGYWCFPADKSVKDGIDWVKRCQLLIKNDSDELLKEIKGYSYQTDKNGKVMETPVKFNDHCLDALRYCLWSHSKRMTRDIPGIRVLDWKGDKSRDEWDSDD